MEIIRSWLKETYPKYKFSVRRDRYSSIDVTLMSADFEAFTKESGYIHHSVNHYWIEKEKGLTDRAREVMTNVRDFVMSYNYDNSDPMTDYFCTNFYLTLGIGKWSTPYKVVLPKLGMKGPKPKTFRHPEGAAHRAIRQALEKGRFRLYREPAAFRLQGIWFGSLRLKGRTLLLAETVFKCQVSTETHRQTGKGRHNLQADRL